MLKRITALLLSLALFFSLCACGEPETAPRAEHELVITVFSLGKADSILVECGGSSMLIDCGEKAHGALLLRELAARGIKRLDVLQITHFDRDHVGGAAAILGEVEVGTILCPAYEGRGKEYFSFLRAAAAFPRLTAVAEPLTMPLGTAECTVYPAEDPSAFDAGADGFDNEMSLVTMLDCGGGRFLFCGDAEKGRIRQMLASDVDWSCDWIKLPHHGRYSKQLARLLRKSGARYAVMTVSDDAPAEEKTLSLLTDLGIEGFDTLSGAVVTTFDDGTLRIATETENGEARK